MDVSSLVLLGALAAGVTGIGLIPSSNSAVWGALGVVIWAVFALGATHVEIFDGGTTYIRTYESIAIVGAALAALNIYIMLFGSVDLFRRAEAEEDMDRGPL